MSKKFLLIISIVVIFLIGGSIIGISLARESYLSEIANLRNEIAQRDKTIETQKGVYEKLVLEKQNVEDVLSTSDQNAKVLREQIKKSHEDLLIAGKAILKWKKALEGRADAIQIEVGNRKRVDFNRDFGHISVRGWTLTDPPESWVSVSQLKPLQVFLTISQDKDKKWHARISSSDDDTQIEIGDFAVNPYFLTPRWYEKIGLGGTFAFWDEMLMGVNLSFPVGKFEIGPAAFIVFDGRPSRFVGIQLSWHPFERN